MSLYDTNVHDRQNRHNNTWVNDKNNAINDSNNCNFLPNNIAHKGKRIQIVLGK